MSDNQIILKYMKEEAHYIGLCIAKTGKALKTLQERIKQLEDGITSVDTKER
jgi:hypothetical protein